LTLDFERYRLITTTSLRVHNLGVSRTRKDSKQTANTVLEIIRRDDGAFDLFLNGQPARANIAEGWLNEEVCVRFGFCGEEYDSIVRHLKRDGRARVVF
jgi:hypothetical protein